MRAARWHGALDVRVEDVPRPRPGPGEVLIRVDRAGICGTDIEEYTRGPVNIPVGWPHPTSGRQAPLTMGHEMVGTVVECGPGVSGLGGRVVPNILVGCGQCWACLRSEKVLCPKVGVRGLTHDGGFAEYVVSEAHGCVPVPAHIDPDVAVFAEPLAVAVRAMAKVTGEFGVAAVIGAGVIGQLMVQLARSSGAAVLAVDPVRRRRELAARFGAITCAPEDAVERVAALTGGRGADLVVECAGVPGGVGSAIELSRSGSTIVLVGVHGGAEMVPLLPLVLEERRLVGSAGHLATDMAAAVALLAGDGVDVGPLRSAVVPLRDVVGHGFERLRTDRDALKILVDPA
ncbi:MAG TPA: alcohol dehydrogenase catalytic domain-containing protein [Actinophytocola sp.]|uniref:alcohol dehydrogenase catalytic domain-containing protein n=1 Tax=Actinophytocola sp. TaxID=1872138 RepID=UPI002DB608DC|nr:alcohol dehydrogenase catalytic domain-containing protein [Actinophytocola sp.]HEU5470778.1 alcohol dehydrogenase catalytic domain-containing protein [Actinophytocola sp.]